MLKTKSIAIEKPTLSTVREDGLLSEVKELAKDFYDGDPVKEKEIKALINLYYALPKKTPTPIINIHSNLYLSWNFQAGHKSKSNKFNIYVHGVDKAGAAISWNYEAHFNSTYPEVFKAKGSGNFVQKLPAELKDALSMFFSISGHGYDW
jgi:hypothetical protein